MQKKTYEERIKIADKESEKFNSEVAVLITSGHHQYKYLEYCIRSIKDIGYKLLVFDKPMDRVRERIPNDYILENVDHILIKHKTPWLAGPTYPQFWNFKLGFDILNGSNCKYIFHTCGDCVLENPDGFKILLNKLKESNKDILACSNRSESQREPFLGTKSFIVKKESFGKIIEFLIDTFLPFDRSFGNMENRFGYAVEKYNLEVLELEKQPFDHQFSHAYDDDGNTIDSGDFGDIMGFRHLGGEEKNRRLRNIRKNKYMR